MKLLDRIQYANPVHFCRAPKNPSPHGKLIFKSVEFVPVNRPDGTVITMRRVRSFCENRNKIKSLLGHGKTRRRLRKFLQRKTKAEGKSTQAA